MSIKVNLITQNKNKKKEIQIKLNYHYLISTVNSQILIDIYY